MLAERAAIVDEATAIVEYDARRRRRRAARRRQGPGHRARSGRPTTGPISTTGATSPARCAAARTNRSARPPSTASRSAEKLEQFAGDNEMPSCAPAPRSRQLGAQKLFAWVVVVLSLTSICPTTTHSRVKRTTCSRSFLLVAALTGESRSPAGGPETRTTGETGHHGGASRAAGQDHQVGEAPLRARDRVRRARRIVRPARPRTRRCRVVKDDPGSVVTQRVSGTVGKRRSVS